MSPVCRLLLVFALALGTAFTPNAASAARQYVHIPLADGFDFPVGKPDGFAYYIRRGFRPNGHMGEDWNGLGGSNSDKGDPVYSIADGVVVYSKDYASNWGNVVIVRHAFRESGQIRYLDSLYGHLEERTVEIEDVVARGEKIGTIGTNRGMYIAHLHFEIRKNINVALVHRRYAMDYSNYYSPKPFIEARRSLPLELTRIPVPIHCFESGVKSAFTRPKLTSLPELPFGKPKPLPKLDRSLQEILVRHQLRPGTPEQEKSSAEELEFEEEREKIRTFWENYKTEIFEKERVNHPIK